MHTPYKHRGYLDAERRHPSFLGRRIPVHGSQWWLGAILLLAVALVYAPVRQAGFIWDDDFILTANPDILGTASPGPIWAHATHQPAFAPLTRSTLWIEHDLWGLAPGPYHIVNVLLHGACAVVLWRVLLALEVPGAWLGAALWALHPVEVESAGWISEMKNTESGVFFLLAILFFVIWFKHRRWGFDGIRLHGPYALMLLFSALAMLGKASTVVLPLVLCLCAWYLERRARWWHGLAVVPVFLMSLAVSFISILEQGRQIAGIAGLHVVLTWPERIAIAGNDVWFYLGKMVWPASLSAIYPKWGVNASQASAYLPALCVAGTLLVLWHWRKSWGRPLFFAFAYFLIALLPVLGFVSNTIFQYAWTFDHLQYLASMAPMALIGAGMAVLFQSAEPEKRWVVATVVGASLLLLATLTWQRAAVFSSSEKLWTDTLSKNPDTWVAHYNLADELAAQGKLKEALPEFETTLELKPPLAAVYDRIGKQMWAVGRFDDAVSCYRAALRIQPEDAASLRDLGQSLQQQGKLDEAITDFRAAERLDPSDDSTHIDFGVALAQAGRLDEAIAEYRTGLKLDAGVENSHFDLALALMQKGRLDEAIAEFRRAVALNPNDADAHYQLGNALVREKQFQAAVGEYRAALQLDPASAKAHNNLGIALLQSARVGEAVAEFKRALELQPDFSEAQQNLDLTEAAMQTPASPIAR